MIDVSGCTDMHTDGTISEVLAGEFHDNFRNITAILEHAGTGYDDVVDMKSYHVRFEHTEIFARITDEFVIEPYPARTTISVASLVVREALLETRAAPRIPSTTNRSA